MKERPILFSAPMVRAILAGTKTQTRRVVKPQPYVDDQGNACWNGLNFGQDGRVPLFKSLASPLPSSKTGRVHCPYGQPGDRLWVRETWNTFDGWAGYFYAADDHTWGIGESDDPDHVPEHAIRWRPSIHMPRAASRITLEITSVRVERLQEISDMDALAEGVDREQPSYPKLKFSWLWKSINGPESWDANPWVWVVEFKRVEAA